MYLYRTLLFLQIVAFIILYQISGGNSSTVIASTASTLDASPTVNGSSSTLVVSMTTAVAVTASTSTITWQPTPATSTAAAMSSSSVATPPTTTPPPSEGAQEAVVMTVEQMTLGEFEEKKSSFISTLRTVVDNYCARDVTCKETSRKRRATTVEQVYVVSGYPKESSPGVLQVAVFVSTGDNKFLSKDVLVVIVEEFRGNLSDALGKRITGWGRLHIDFAKTTESTGSSGKNRVLYYFFAGFAGVVLVLVVFVSVTCWIGRRSEKQTKNEVRPLSRPLTTSNLELVEQDQGGRVNEGFSNPK